FVKVEDVTVRVALAEDRYKSENQALKSEGLNVCADKTLGSNLRCPVKRRLHGKLDVLRSWKDGRFTVYRPRRAEDKSANARCAHCLKDIVRRDDVLFEVAI